MIKKDNIILGAGISGLTINKILKGDNLVLEKTDEIGGLCNSIKKQGFIFDKTGHYLHVKDNNKKRIFDSINCKMNRITKKTGVAIKGRIINYPFQSNFHSINEDIKKECIEGYFKRDKNKCINNFQDWILKYFGNGMAKYFFSPYNKKLWQYELKKMSIEWIDFIPRVNDNDVLHGNNSLNSYNAYFYYPESGGFYHILPIIDKSDMMFNEKIKSIDIEKKLIYTNSDIYKYNRLISTIPLKLLMELINGKEEQLIYTSVYNINLGIKGKIKNDYQWIYFPEEEIPFYRIGIPSNVNKNMAPPEHYSLSIELAYRDEYNFDFNKIIYYLKKYHLPKSEKDIIIKHNMNIEYAYVIYNNIRQQYVRAYTDFLSKHNVFLTGRFGRWHYSFVSNDIMEAIKLAEVLND